MSIFNSIVRIYLKRHQKTVSNIRFKSLFLQERELVKILRSPLYRNISMDAFFDCPPTTYDSYQKDIDARMFTGDGKFRSISAFAKSAGTSGAASKYIPTAKAYLKRNHIAAGWLTMHLMYALRPDMDIISNKNLLVGGAVYEENSDYTVADISGLLIRKIPKAFHKFYVPSIAEATMPDWEEKLKITSEKASNTEKVVMIAGVPTWILTLSKEILKISSKKCLTEVWPNLKVYLHGGVKMEPYHQQFLQLIPKQSRVLFMEVYNASEGFFAVQDTPVNEGMLLLTCHGIYYEFIKLTDYRAGVNKIFSLKDVECSEEYVILITNMSGLCRYIIGDTVSFTSKNPFRIVVKGRISEYINAFGEDLGLDIVNRSISEVCMKHDTTIRNYTVAPKYISIQEKGYHQWYVEFEKEPRDLISFTRDLDVNIQNKNFNYFQKRSDNLALKELEVVPLPKGFYDAFAKSQKKYGGQNKLPKLKNDRSLADQIEEALDMFLKTSEHHLYEF